MIPMGKLSEEHLRAHLEEAQRYYRTMLRYGSEHRRMVYGWPRMVLFRRVAEFERAVWRPVERERRRWRRVVRAWRGEDW